MSGYESYESVLERMLKAHADTDAPRAGVGVGPGATAGDGPLELQLGAGRPATGGNTSQAAGPLSLDLGPPPLLAAPRPPSFRAAAAQPRAQRALPPSLAGTKRPAAGTSAAPAADEATAKRPRDASPLAGILQGQGAMQGKAAASQPPPHQQLGQQSGQQQPGQHHHQQQHEQQQQAAQRRQLPPTLLKHAGSRSGEASGSQARAGAPEVIDLSEDRSAAQYAGPMQLSAAEGPRQGAAAAATGADDLRRAAEARVRRAVAAGGLSAGAGANGGGLGSRVTASGVSSDVAALFPESAAEFAVRQAQQQRAAQLEQIQRMAAAATAAARGGPGDWVQALLSPSVASGLRGLQQQLPQLLQQVGSGRLLPPSLQPGGRGGSTANGDFMGLVRSLGAAAGPRGLFNGITGNGADSAAGLGPLANAAGAAAAVGPDALPAAAGGLAPVSERGHLRPSGAEAQRAVRAVLEGLAMAGDDEREPPEGALAVPMLKHQKLALSWMCRRERGRRVSGGILADDQGLGKTVTTIALVLTHPRGGDYLMAVDSDGTASDSDDGEAAAARQRRAGGVLTGGGGGGGSIKSGAGRANGSAGPVPASSSSSVVVIDDDDDEDEEDGTTASGWEGAGAVDSEVIDLLGPSSSEGPGGSSGSGGGGGGRLSLGSDVELVEEVGPTDGEGPRAKDEQQQQQQQQEPTADQEEKEEKQQQPPQQQVRRQQQGALNMAGASPTPPLPPLAPHDPAAHHHGKPPVGAKPRAAATAAAAPAGPRAVAEGREGGLPEAGTLVVCPTSLLHQWAREVKQKVNPGHGCTVHVHHGKDKVDARSVLSTFTIVLTTYGTLASEAPAKHRRAAKAKKQGSAAAPIDLAEEDEEGEEGGSAAGRGGKKRGGGADGGPLFQLRWTRVVLDEAQSIKNARTLAAHAAWAVEARHRWCLTGTPIQNSVDDLFSYFRFLRYAPFDSPGYFKKHIKDAISPALPRTRAEDGYRRLQATLRAVLLRRTKATRINGVPIVAIPPRRQEVVKATFSDAEREFYEGVEKEAAQRLAAIQAEAGPGGGSGGRYMNLLLLLLKLRQACNHPWLVRGGGERYGRAPGAVTAGERAAAARLPPDQRAAMLAALAAPDALCPACQDVPEDPSVTRCCHIYCRQCVAAQVAAAGGGSDAEFLCGGCSSAVRGADVFSGAALEAVSPAPSGGSVAGKGPARDAASRPGSSSGGGGGGSSGGGWQSSAKVDRLIALLDRVRAANAAAAAPPVPAPTAAAAPPAAPPPAPRSRFDRALSSQFRRAASPSPAPGSRSASPPAAGGGASPDNAGGAAAPQPEKVLVFSQWTSMLDLLEVPLKARGFEYRRLDGSMPVPARERAVADFEARPGVLVLLVSLKAAALGLNLVAANHVVLMDLWWNPTVEEQAIDRAHRIGQTRPVNVTRITIPGTVEDRIMALQDEKRKLIDAALSEGGIGGGAAARLTTDDLMYLFTGRRDR